MLQFLRKLRRDEKGVTLIEYTLAASLIAVAAIAGMKATGVSIQTMFTNIGTVVGTDATSIK